MIRIFYRMSICALALAAHQLAAQPLIPNGDFETWTITNGIEKPTPWTSYTSFSTPIVKSTDAHSGTYALKIQNKAGSGQRAFSYIPKGAGLAGRLQGFIKYSLDPGQKAVVRVSASYTETTSTQTATYSYIIGWQTFTGTSVNYVPIDIPLDYAMFSRMHYNNGTFESYQIQISAYDDLENASASLAGITDNSNVIVDDLTFTGTGTPVYYNSLTPEGFENWVTMDNHTYLRGWTDLSNPYKKDYQKIVSRTTDAREGTYAVKLNLPDNKDDFDLVQLYTHSDPSQNLQLSLKYQLNRGDTVRALFISSDFEEMIQPLVITEETKTAYQDVVLDISSLTKDKKYFFFINVKKTSATGLTTFLQVDGLKLVAANGLDNETFAGNKLVVYPNPSANGIFKLNQTEVKAVAVFNASGQKVEPFISLTGSETLIDLSNQPKGVYTLQVNGSLFTKVIY